MRTQLYKNTAGQWIFDGGSMPSGSCYERYRNGTVRIYLLNQAILFEGKVSDLLRGDGTPYENYAVFKSECGDFFVNPLNPLKEDVEGLQEDVEGLREDVSAIQGGYLGTLLHTDAAPEPGKSGIYKFISAGVVSWLSGTPTVAVGDEVSVVFTDPTYTYTHIQNPYELLANKQNSLAVDGTGVKYPTVDTLNANFRSYTPTIPYANRVLADSGVISDLEKLTKLYIENLKLLDNTVFLWDGSAGIKTRTSGANTFATKLYDMSAGNRDAAQTTEANQPFIGGNIAPNEKICIKTIRSTDRIKHNDISFTSTQPWSVTTVFNCFDAQIANGSVFIFGAEFMLRYSSSGTFYFRNASNTYINTGVSSSGFVNKTTIATLIANGSGLLSLFINGSLKGTVSADTAVVFGNVIPSSGYFNGYNKHYHHQVFDKALSAAEVQAQHAYLRLQHPEIEGIDIGTQHWATSNYEGVVTGDGTVIPEVQGASTADNPELVVGGDFESGLIGSNDDGGGGGVTSTWSLNTSNPISGTQDGRLVITTAGSGGNSAYRPQVQVPMASMKQNQRYIIKFDYKVNSGTVIWSGISLGIGANSLSPITLSGTGTTQREFTITGTQSSLLFLYFNGTNLFDLQIDNITIKEVGWADLTIPAWCYYNNDPLNGAVYGKLYNWYAVQAIAANPPAGWRIPTLADFTQLTNFLGGSAVAGGKLKKEGLSYWITPNTGVTNESGFSAIGAGIRRDDLGFVNSKGYISLASSNKAGNGYGYALTKDNTTFQRNDFLFLVNEKTGQSIRLIRNEPVGDNERTIETGYITNALGATNLDIPIPFGYQVESIRFDSETDITGLSAKLLTGALVELETLFTAKSVTANVQKVIAADADQSIQQTDAVVRINGTKADTTKRFRVWVKLTKVVFS